MNEKDIIPQGANSLIKPYEAATKSAAGLAMENTSNTAAAPVRGTILASGSESKFKAGQEIFYRRYSADKCVILTPEGEKEYVLVDDVDILAIINTNNKRHAPRTSQKGKKSQEK